MSAEVKVAVAGAEFWKDEGEATGMVRALESGVTP